MSNVRNDIDGLLEEPPLVIPISTEVFKMVQKAIENPPEPTDGLKKLIASNRESRVG